MLTKKIVSSTIAVAFTASVALLSGCPTQGVTPDPNATATPDPNASATVAPSASVAPTAAPTAAPTVAPTTAGSTGPTSQPSGTSTPAPNSSTVPVGQTGGTSDIKERATFNGKVYDPDGIPVEGAKVTAKSVDPQVSWIGEEQITTNGAYVFRNAPVGARVEVTVTKDNWTSRTRTEVLKSNLQGDPTANVFDFGGLNNQNDVTGSFYSIQDEPEITSLKINGRLASNSGGFPTGSSTKNNGTAIANSIPVSSAELKSGLRSGLSLSTSLSGVDNSTLDVELVFSEPVDRQSVQNNFKILSQDFDVRENVLPKGTGFEIDENYSTVTFTWAADDRSVLVKTNKPILTTTSSPEARYLLKWTNPFKDKANNSALTIGQGNVSPTGHFKYNPGTNNDFNVFSTKIDDQSPRLLSIAAVDGGSSNDTIRLTFNEPLDVINHASYALGLGDPTDTSNASDRQLWAYNTANTGNDPRGGGNVSGNAPGVCTDLSVPADGDTTDQGECGEAYNQATVLGYTQGSANLGDFKPVYMIARLPQNITVRSQVVAYELGVDYNQQSGAKTARAGLVMPGTVPMRANPTGTLNTALLRFARIDGNVVTLEFAPEAFDKNEKILVSVGENIDTSYTDSSRNIPRTEIIVQNRDGNGNTVSYTTYDKDPAGNNMSTGNSTNSGNVQVDDSLRVSTAS